MENLFIEPIKFEDMSKEASVYLDKDQTTWVKSIMGRFIEKFPMLQNQGIKLVWTKQDPNKGYAVGALKVLGGAVPVIVRDFYLYPMDVIMFGDKALPLTTDTLQQILSNPEPFKGIAGSNPKNSLELFSPDLQISPTESALNHGGNTGLTRPAKYASIIDSIEHVDKESIKKILSEVNSDEAIKNAFIANDNWDVVEKVAEKSTESKETEVESFVRQLDVDRQYTYEDQFGNNIVKSANSAVDHVWEVNVKPEEADSVERKTAEASLDEEVPTLKGNTYKITDDNTLYVADNNDYHVFDKNIKLATTFDIKEDTPTVGDTGTFILNGVATKPFEISSIEKVANDNVGVAVPLTNGKDTLYIHGDKSYGLYFEKEAQTDVEALMERLEGSDPQVGDTGCFVLEGKATKPFEITSMMKNTDAGQWEIETYDGLNKVSYYPIKPKASEFEAHEQYAKSYYVPGNSKFVKLGSYVEDVEGLTKTAAEKGSVHITTWDGMNRKTYYLVDENAEQYADHNFDSSAAYIPKNATYIKLNRNIEVTSTPAIEKVAHHRIERDSAGLYSLHGPQFDKYAENQNGIRNLLVDDAIWSCIHCGVTENEVDKIAGMKSNSSLDVFSDVKAPYPVSALSEAVEKGYTEKMAEININTDLIKEAAVISDKGTVDAVLSLGLLKKDNVLEFVNLLPQYETVMGELAKLLVISRLGLSNIPEAAIARAMTSLTRVILLLKQIKTVHKD